ncbi:MAG: tRNA (adenosine(37)-N6)-threonylcarbamoyltransferase complex ATPase subunit type 1 TsaE [Clostridia bacterium]|nr:tRNA (adenosine(37)-N6)-threonylcarbamoyltransferase complex ATPase subunit type 1 TsaE [Clostridia bacterium]
MKIITKSQQETENFAKEIGKKLKGDEIIALYGDLGVGKTVFTRGLVSCFGTKNAVTSPTFTLVNEYAAPKFKIYHFDMYRIKNLEDLESTGFFDYMYKGVFVIEWSENIENYLPEKTIKIYIEKNENDSERIITLKGWNNK